MEKTARKKPHNEPKRLCPACMRERRLAFISRPEGVCKLCLRREQRAG